MLFLTSREASSPGGARYWSLGAGHADCPVRPSQIGYHHDLRPTLPSLDTDEEEGVLSERPPGTARSSIVVREVHGRAVPNGRG